MKRRDITGQIFGRLTAIKFAKIDDKKKTVWFFKCSCNPKKIVEKSLNNVIQGVTKSCGCLGIEQYRINGHLRLRHGMSRSRPYNILMAIKKRCTNKKHPYYKNYGGRGISFDPRWKKFENFWEDMKETYKDNLEIDRIDNNMGYSKNNCRWTTEKENCNNRRSHRFITYRGETHNITQWAEKIGMPIKLIYDRIVRFHWPVEKAFNKPKHTRIWTKKRI